ncbi:MAG: DUF3800 domain-containing protein, partial [Thermomicrobiales bacterium]
MTKFAGLADARIQPRKRTAARVWPVGIDRPEYVLFLDECGVHNLDLAKDPFPVFCLCGVIVAADRYDAFDALWKGWKTQWLGDPKICIHETEVRHRSNWFHEDDPNVEQERIDALSAQLAELEFTCIDAVIDKRRFATLYPTGKVDDFLPTSAYLMCVDFVFERFVHFLHHVGNDARGVVQAESRGPREDAEVHSEFLRFHLEGTQWHADQQFRHQLRPYIEFLRKSHNVSGVQIADLAARPIAEKVLRPETTPVRWEFIEPKMYDGLQGRKSSYELKIFPSPEEELIFGEGSIKTNEDAK